MTYLTRAWIPGVLVLSLALVGCQRPSAQAPAGGGYATRSSGGEVSFEITPRGMVDGRFVVDVRANTHSGDLAEVDLGGVVALAVDGRELRPARADRLQGHHAAGSVAFQISPAPARFEIVLRGVRSMPARRLQWP